MRKQKQASFVKNAAILSFAGIFSRMLGAIYRIPLTRLIGREGMGLYQMGYSIYALLLAVSATGIPVAISKLVSEEATKNRMGEARRIFKIATILLTSIGVIFTIGFMLTAPFISKNIVKEPRAFYPMVAVAPAIFIVALMASIKGFFQGLQMMWPTAIAQLSEQFGRIITVLALSWYLVSINSKLEITAAGASFGAVIGSLVGLIVIIFIYLKNKPFLNQLTRKSPRVSKRSTKQIIKRILVFAIPITIGAMVLPFMNGIDTVLVKSRLLKAGIESTEALSLYGDLTTVIPLINLPSMLAYALAASLVPAISMASSAGKWREVRSRSKLAIKLILMIGFPAALGLSLLATPVTGMLFGFTNSAQVLQILAFAVIFLTLHQCCTGILQGLGYTGLPVRNLLIGGLVKIVLNYSLIAIPTLNIRGAAISSVIAYGVASFLNVRSVCKHTGLKFEFYDMLVRPLISTGIMGIFVYGSYSMFVKAQLSDSLSALASVAIGVTCYGVAVLVTQCFSKSELEAIPYVGPVIIKFAGKFRLLRRD